MLQEGMDYDSPIYERVNQLILEFTLKSRQADL